MQVVVAEGREYITMVVACLPAASSPPYHIVQFFLFLFLFVPVFYRSKKSSSSSSQFLRRLTTIFSSSFFSATALRSSLSCSSVTFARSWPDCASAISRFSISAARSSLTRRMRPRRSAASGCRIWLRMLWRASSCCLCPFCQIYHLEKRCRDVLEDSLSLLFLVLCAAAAATLTATTTTAAAALRLELLETSLADLSRALVRRMPKEKARGATCSSSESSIATVCCANVQDRSPRRGSIAARLEGHLENYIRW